MGRRLTISAGTTTALTVARRAVRKSKVVYIICTPRPQKYKHGRSRIIYIGTTERGVRRAASSAAHKAIDFLERWGVKWLDVYLVTCPPRPGVRSWARLERDLLITFKLEYGTVPEGNTSGKNLGPYRLSGLFNYRRLCAVLDKYAGDDS